MNDTNNQPALILLSTWADDCGIDRSHARKYLKRQGFELHRIRTAQSGGQECLALTPDDAEQAKSLRQQQGFAETLMRQGRQSGNGNGCFYLIQLVPELDVSRVKLGFAVSLADRFATHRTTCPTATIISHWPCRPAWEIAAIACATRQDCSPLSNEVFVCQDIPGMVARIDAFFGNMPAPDFRLE